MLFDQQPTPKYIVDAEIVTIGARRPELGWQRWTGHEFSYPVTTLPALEAVQAAKDPAVGGLRASDELDSALRRPNGPDSIQLVRVSAESGAGGLDGSVPVH
ncbi:MAG: hypothetical protein ACRDTD_18500 [Pseudonocardiaceae bacterium]